MRARLKEVETLRSVHEVNSHYLVSTERCQAMDAGRRARDLARSISEHAQTLWDVPRRPAYNLAHSRSTGGLAGPFVHDAPPRLGADHRRAALFGHPFRPIGRRLSARQTQS